ncbi:hypothetical protein [Streptomyces sp. NPDC014622]|uniref:hypothetical protein n=1 Tax=Streptomyces sp. NPDC014622 TaxID=3364874 RepID=UPI0036FF10AD
MLRDQGEVFGPVASTPTAWRLLAAVDERALDRMRSARARAGEVAWPQHRTLFDELTALPPASPPSLDALASWGVWWALARHPGRREHMSDTVQAISVLLSHQQTADLNPTQQV